MSVSEVMPCEWEGLHVLPANRPHRWSYHTSPPAVMHAPAGSCTNSMGHRWRRRARASEEGNGRDRLFAALANGVSIVPSPGVWIKVHSGMAQLQQWMNPQVLDRTWLQVCLLHTRTTLHTPPFSYHIALGRVNFDIDF